LGQLSQIQGHKCKTMMHNYENLVTIHWLWNSKSLQKTTSAYKLSTCTLETKSKHLLATPVATSSALGIHRTPCTSPPSSIFKNSRTLCTLIQESKVIGPYISFNKNLIGTHLRVPLLLITSIWVFHAPILLITSIIYNIIVILGKIFIKYPIF
jgi:hypothetical protein